MSRAEVNQFGRRLEHSLRVPGVRPTGSEEGSVPRMKKTANVITTSDDPYCGRSWKNESCRVANAGIRVASNER
jgi:hypothetical protein